MAQMEISFGLKLTIKFKDFSEILPILFSVHFKWLLISFGF